VLISSHGLLADIEHFAGSQSGVYSNVFEGAVETVNVVFHTEGFTVEGTSDVENHISY
jgi:hypothetical protein